MTEINFKNIFLFLLVLFSESQITKAQKLADKLLCNDQINPVAIHTPYFGWEFNDYNNNSKQFAYQILVASNLNKLNEANADIWNSGKVKSSSQNYIYLPEKNLKSDKQYYWKVKIWKKEKNESTYSQPATFRTGLLNNSDWTGAKWICRKNTTNEEYTWFRKTFDLPDKKLIKATLYITASHEYELYIDGALTGNGPGYHYPQYQYYNAYDITTSFKNKSQHSFACLTHWYGSGQGRPKSTNGLLAKAIFEFSDSTLIIIGTDKSWKQEEVKAFLTNQPLRNGEGIGFIDYIDSRFFNDKWKEVSYNDSKWENAIEIGNHPSPPWTGNLTPNYNKIIHEELQPVKITNKGEGNYLIDLGKVYAGVPKITFKGGKAGEDIKIIGGYTLDDAGYISTTTNQGTDMSYTFVLSGKTCTFQPFVYLGMRYIQISDAPKNLTLKDVCFITRHEELDTNASYFHSSNEMLNKVYALMKHSLILGSQESFVDTPTREKGGFLGDSWSIGVTTMNCMNDRLMNLRILEQFLQSQEQYWPDGRLNAVYPNGDGKRDIPDYTQMFLFWIWDYYMITGNKQFLADNYHQIKNVVDYIGKYINPKTGLIHNLEGGSSAYKYGIVDWPADMRYGYDVSVESRTVIDAYAYYDFKIFGLIANELDSSQAAEKYNKQAENMANAINKQLINSEGVYIDGLVQDGTQSTHASQHANMLPLALGLVPEENKLAVKNLVKDKKMSVGMVTLRWLPEAIGEADEGEHLIDLFTNTKWDGWAKTISQGGTATWESWNAISNGESMSHPWGAVGIQSIYKYILGLKNIKPQHELIQIKPLWFGNKLLDAEGTIPTDRGSIKIKWNYDNSESVYKLECSVPDNIRAKIYIPKAGSNSLKVSVNEETINGTFNGDYIYLGEFGAGTYSIVRKAKLVSDLPTKINNKREFNTL